MNTLDIYKNPKLVGRYVKWLMEPYKSMKEENRYDIIKSVENGYTCIFLENFGALDPTRFIDKQIELMPEGFNPNDITNEPIIKIW